MIRTKTGTLNGYEVVYCSNCEGDEQGRSIAKRVGDIYVCSGCGREMKLVDTDPPPPPGLRPLTPLS